MNAPLAANRRQRRIVESMLVSITVVWGLTFSMIKQTLGDLGPLVFMTYRFWLAFAVLAPFVITRVGRVTLSAIRDSALLGGLLFACYALQTIGLQYTTAGNAGFITGLFVVFTPLLARVFLGHKVPGRVKIAVGVAIAGLGLLTIEPGFRPRGGDMLIFLCAITYAAHIVLLDGFSKRHDAVALTMLQIGWLALFSTAAALSFENFRLPHAALSWLTIVVCAVFASALAFWVQTYAQRILSPTRTAMVLITEPVFTVIFAMLLLSERLSARAWVGSALILGAMVLTELPMPRGKRALA